MSVRRMVAGIALSVPLFTAALAATGGAPAETLEIKDRVVVIESHNRKSIIVLPGVGSGRAVRRTAEGMDESRPSAAGAADSPIKFVSEPSRPEAERR